MVTRNERFTENVYQKHLEAILHGGHVDYGIYGITDITTDDFHAEIKSWKSWKNVIGQLTSYNHASARVELRAYMYGDLPNKKKLESMKSFLAKFNINVFHIEICQETLTITDLQDMSTTEHSIGCHECVIEDIDVNKMRSDLRQMYEQSRTNDRMSLFYIDIDDVAKWLKCRKDNLKSTLVQSYENDVDYIILVNQQPGKKFEKILLTADCFKFLCMRSKTERSQIVRKYFIELGSSNDLHNV
jgi:phage anti-repressor protein